MILRYSEKTEDILKVEARIKELSLAYKAEKIDGKVEPALVDGRSEYAGIDEMNGYLDQLAGEREQWYYCDC